MIIRKIMLLGELGVGKTSIANRLVFDRFSESYKSTIGTDIYRYEVTPSPAPEPFHFIVWDTDGSHKEAIFRRVHYKEAHAALVVADAARPSTIDAMIELGTVFAELQPGRYYAHVLNKMDLAPELGDEVLARLRVTGVPLFISSARTGQNVKEAFHGAARDILRLEA